MYTLLRQANKQLKVTTAHSTTGTFHKNTTSMRHKPNQTGQSLSTKTHLERRTHSHHARTRLKGALLQKIKQQKTHAVSQRARRPVGLSNTGNKSLTATQLTRHGNCKKHIYPNLRLTQTPYTLGLNVRCCTQNHTWKPSLSH